MLDDDGLDRLAKAVAEEVRRQATARPAKAKPATAGGAASVTPGQERPILAAFEAGPTPAAIAREFRLARATVQQVVAAARRGRR